jgi:hypothetical protein
VLFFQLMNRRYEHASTVLTSNKGFDQWGEVLGDDVMAAALIDRVGKASTARGWFAVTGSSPVRPTTGIRTVIVSPRRGNCAYAMTPFVSLQL